MDSTNTASRPSPATMYLPVSISLADAGLIVFTLLAIFLSELVYRHFTVDSRFCPPDPHKPTPSRLIRHFLHLPNPSSTQPQSPQLSQQSHSGLLTNLPTRCPLPSPSPSPTPTDANLTTSTHLLHSIAASNPTTSYLGHTTVPASPPGIPALYARRRAYPHTLYLGQICRIDPDDGTLTLQLCARDAAEVVRAGWGVRRETQSQGWCSWWWRARRGEVAVCAPRDEVEEGVVGRIVEAGVWWVAGGGGESVC